MIVRAMLRPAALAALLLLATTANAQGRGTIVTGTVYDSLASAPLAGAVVQIVQVDSGAGSRNYTATADAAGRYRVDSLPRGRFGIGFQHPSLNAIGLESPLRAFQIGIDTTLVIDLAIPGGQQVRAQSCPASAASDGMLAGVVTDAMRGTTVAGATVTLGWVEVGVVDKVLKTVPKRMQVKSGDDGTYVACGIASGSPLVLEVTSPGYRMLLGEITVPDSSAARRDFRLADTTMAAVGSAVTGRMVHEGDRPVASGRVSIASLDVDAPVENGAFSIPNVPPGTWQLEARVIGYEPQTLLVDVGVGAPANVTLTVDRKVQVLDAITVVGKATGDIKVLNDVVRRNRASTGTMFLPSSNWLQTAIYPADVLRAARGFSYLSMDKIRARGCSLIGGMGPTKRLVVYLDGFRFAGGFEELGTMVSMRDVIAVEAYPDMMGVPSMYFSNDACAVVSIWTKR